ncbi:hypothetical protein M9H77_06908 [Catharanthus roseus]|uniref:Uncharacterized protein n=1 Tax=Catharanthus roseus TaxID=4058 RepID=A0ACC0BTU7_CATRO|nr:hypothetical protein M9H77_06908 [Catharanthus roseus]
MKNCEETNIVSIVDTDEVNCDVLNPLSFKDVVLMLSESVEEYFTDMNISFNMAINHERQQSCGNNQTLKQDIVSKKRIGSARWKQGLFVLDDFPSSLSSPISPLSPITLQNDEQKCEYQAEFDAKERKEEKGRKWEEDVGEKIQSLEFKT